MDNQALLDGLRAAVPYNVHLGLEYVAIEPGRCTVRLPDDERLRNHVGSQHASGLFSLGEAASGGAFTSAFAEQLAELRPLVTKAEIAYSKLALGASAAEAAIDEPLASIAQRLDNEGVVIFEVAVAMRDVHENEVAQMSVHWRMKRSGHRA